MSPNICCAVEAEKLPVHEIRQTNGSLDPVGPEEIGRVFGLMEVHNRRIGKKAKPPIPVTEPFAVLEGIVHREPPDRPRRDMMQDRRFQHHLGKDKEIPLSQSHVFDHSWFIARIILQHAPARMIVTDKPIPDHAEPALWAGVYYRG